MKKQNLVGMLAMMAMMSDTDAYGISEEIKENTPKNKVIPKGMKEFFYGDNSLYALNQKNADKKARKKGYLYI